MEELLLVPLLLLYISLMFRLTPAILYYSVCAAVSANIGSVAEIRSIPNWNEIKLKRRRN